MEVTLFKFINQAGVSQLLVFLAALLANLFMAFPFINFLYKIGFFKTKKTEGVDVTKRNPFWYNHLGDRLDTPSSFGLLLLPNILMVFIIFRSLSTTLYLTLIFTVIFLLFGFLDDYIKFFYFLKHKKWGMAAYTKLLIQLCSLVYFLWILKLGFFETIFFSLVISFIINAYNITDGLDGLVGNLTILTLPVLAFFEFKTMADINFLNFYAVLLGFFIVFIYFNIKPARVMLGDVGSMSIGFFLGVLALRYNMLAVLTLYAIFITEGLSSFIQIVSIKVFKKKVFIIAPLHLHLLNKGWTDTKIVQRTALLQIVLSVISIIIFEYTLWK